MTRTEYLLTVLNQTDAYLRSHWVFSVFTVTLPKEEETAPYPYQLKAIDNQYHYFDESSKSYLPISDSPNAGERPLWKVQEGITINNQSELIQPYAGGFPLRTRVGTLFVNYYCLVSCFDKRIPYQNGTIDVNKLQGLVAKQLIDYGEPQDGTKVYPDEAKKFISACASMAAFANIANPSATTYTMRAAPGITEFRDKLLEENKYRLDDPAIVADIEKQLVAYDKAFQAQDPDGGFYIDEKAFAVSRKKLFVMGGLEQPEVSGGRKVLIPRSLSEGIDPKYIPIMNDTMRDGSYNRGALTALGGVEVKFIFRVFSMTKIIMEDCGTKVGLPTLINERNLSTYIGNTVILPNKEQKEITSPEDLKPYIGQRLMIRSPGLCQTPGSSFCSVCVGRQLKGSENSLAALASEVGSKMLDIFMAKMHGTALTTTKWRWQETIS